MLKETVYFRGDQTFEKRHCREGDNSWGAEGRWGRGRGGGGEGGGGRRWRRIWESLRSRGKGSWWRRRSEEVEKKNCKNCFVLPPTDLALKSLAKWQRSALFLSTLVPPTPVSGVFQHGKVWMLIRRIRNDKFVFRWKSSSTTRATAT